MASMVTFSKAIACHTPLPERCWNPKPRDESTIRMFEKERLVSSPWSANSPKWTALSLIALDLDDRVALRTLRWRTGPAAPTSLAASNMF